MAQVRKIVFAPISDCDVPYTSVFSSSAFPAHAHQTLDVFVPQTFNRLSQTVPVVLFVQGGNCCKDVTRRVAKGISKNTGVVVVAPDCRWEQSDDEKHNDMHLALQWLLGHIGWYGGDVNNVFAVGVGRGIPFVQRLASNFESVIKNSFYTEEMQENDLVRFFNEGGM